MQPNVGEEGEHGTIPLLLPIFLLAGSGHVVRGPRGAPLSLTLELMLPPNSWVCLWAHSS